MEERNARSTPFRGGSFEVVYPPEHLNALMSKGSAEHPVTGKKNSLEIVRHKGMSRWVIEQGRNWDLIASALGAHSDLLVSAI
jgi:hypothetical protein